MPIQLSFALIVMASRVIYGMAREGLVPNALGALNIRRQTPARAIVLVTVLIAVLTVGFPLVNLAQATSLVTLGVFTLVNLALWRIDGRAMRTRFCNAGVIGVYLALVLAQVYSLSKRYSWPPRLRQLLSLVSTHGHRFGP